MAFLQSLSLFQFKNYKEAQSYHFDSPVVCITGKNGIGKTNLLDAIYILSFTKSYFKHTDNQLTHKGLQGVRIEGNYLINNQSINTTLIFRNEKKELYYQGALYKKYAQHIGKIPCVMIAPDDLDLINGGGEMRRKFIDMLIAQISPEYLEHLMCYQQALKSRNLLLQEMKMYQREDKDILDAYSNELIRHGQIIFQKRCVFLQQLIPTIIAQYQLLQNDQEPVSITYKSQLHEQDFKQLIDSNYLRDRSSMRTQVGIHKDDLEFMTNGLPSRTFASQGQKKTLLFACKLSEWIVLKEHHTFPPICLLDDLFEKLDPERSQYLINWIGQQSTGQFFITDTDAQRLTTNFQKNNASIQLIALT
ncbi:MAG: DNA replication and repair protein RecF [Phycisphaerales bacterium]|nr:DNA replication and repair protein RecF [Phycisphaerales bacterium]